MNKQMKIILCVVLVFAFALMIVCGIHYTDLRNQLRDTGEKLAQSLETWKSIDREKRLVQDELKGIRNELKEANQTITELSDIQAEIEDLRMQIDALKAADK